jgi:hypothetical protein
MTTLNVHSSGVSAAGPETPRATRRGMVERRDLASRHRLLHRVLAEFREMPCLRLTAEQARRLFGLRGDVSARVIDELVRDGRIRRDHDGRYVAKDLG